MKIIAHRGNDEINRENSIIGILNSLDKKYVDGVEFDIRVTRDFKFVIHHDPFYKGHLIKSTSLKKLRKLGLNSLEDLLIRIKSKKIILIEIKEESRIYRIQLARLNRILKKYNLNYYVFSFNYDLMKYFKKKYPNIKNGLLIGVKKNLDKINNDFNFNGVNYRHAYKSLNKETFIWTINTKEEYENVLENQNIITDKAKFIYDLVHKN